MLIELIPTLELRCGAQYIPLNLQALLLFADNYITALHLIDILYLLCQKLLLDCEGLVGLVIEMDICLEDSNVLSISKHSCYLLKWFIFSVRECCPHEYGSKNGSDDEYDVIFPSNGPNDENISDW